MDSVEVLSHNPVAAEVKIGNSILKYSFKQAPQQLEPLFGDSWSTMVWEASVELSKYLLSNEDLEGKAVLELGAGLGLCGIVAGLNRAKLVVLTEKAPELSFLRENLNLNASVIRSAHIYTEELDWGKPDHLRNIKSGYSNFDIILISDCISADVYGADSYQKLLTIMESMSTNNTMIYLCSSIRKQDGLADFIILAKQIFTNIRLLHQGENRDGDFHIYAIRK